MHNRLLLLTGIGTLLAATSLQASPIIGVFNIAGTIVVSNTTITWVSNHSPFAPNEATIGPGATGSFAGLDGTDVTIDDLVSATEPVGVAFPQTPFISFDAAPLLPGLDINFLFPGIFGTAECNLPAAVGQVCTPNPPITPVQSPFNLVNNPGTGGPEAVASFVFSGLSSDGLSRWNANFTSQFSVPFQQVLSDLAANGTVSNTFSATITVTAVPEAGTGPLLAIGLVLVAISLRVRRSV